VIGSEAFGCGAIEAPVVGAAAPPDEPLSRRTTITMIAARPIATTASTAIRAGRLLPARCVPPGRGRLT
jgi:hypothetical protein